MKTKTNIALFLLVAVSASFVPARASTESSASYDSKAKMYSVSEVNLKDFPAIEEGVAASTIRMTVGTPYVQLTRDLWVYTQFRPNSDLARAEECDLLFIAFDDKKVAEMYFANDEAWKVVSNRIKAGERSNEVVLAAVGPKPSLEVASNQ